jgi:nitroreductase
MLGVRRRAEGWYYTKRLPASEGDILGMMSLGCVMENMWLMAESLGLGFHLLSALSALGVDEELRDILGIPQQMNT